MSKRSTQLAVRSQVLLSLAAALSFLAGCRGKPEPVEVQGRVTLDGAPLADAHVSFEPTASNDTSGVYGSTAVTDADGRFNLKTIHTGELGAMPGEHLVRITTVYTTDAVSESATTPPELVPTQYRAGIPFTVPKEGTAGADFALTSQP